MLGYTNRLLHRQAYFSAALAAKKAVTANRAATGDSFRRRDADLLAEVWAGAHRKTYSINGVNTPDDISPDADGSGWEDLFSRRSLRGRASLHRAMERRADSCGWTAGRRWTAQTGRRCSRPRDVTAGVYMVVLVRRFTRTRHRDVHRCDFGAATALLADTIGLARTH